jgi:hypothetical protein
MEDTTSIGRLCKMSNKELVDYCLWLRLKLVEKEKVINGLKKRLFYTAN